LPLRAVKARGVRSNRADARGRDQGGELLHISAVPVPSAVTSEKEKIESVGIMSVK